MFFRTSSPWKLKTFNRTSGLQDSLALGSSELVFFPAMFFLAMIFRTSNPWKLETFIQNFWSSDFFKHLIRSTIFRGWDCSSELPVQSLQKLLGKSSEYADADDLLIRNRSSEALWIVFGLRMQLLMKRLLLQNQNLFKALSSNH